MCRSSASTRLKWNARISPAGVGTSPRAVRSNSEVPRRASRSFTAVLMAGCVIANSRATAAMLRRSTRLAMTARRRPFMIDANSELTSADDCTPPRAISC